MERAAPYRLLLELARGKVNQVRCQAADWRMGGLHIGPLLQNQIHEATMAFGNAVSRRRCSRGRRRGAGMRCNWLTRPPNNSRRPMSNRCSPSVISGSLGSTRRSRCRLGPAVPAAEPGEALLQSINSLSSAAVVEHDRTRGRRVSVGAVGHAPRLGGTTWRRSELRGR